LFPKNSLSKIGTIIKNNQEINDKYFLTLDVLLKRAKYTSLSLIIVIKSIKQTLSFL